MILKLGTTRAAHTRNRLIGLIFEASSSMPPQQVLLHLYLLECEHPQMQENCYTSLLFESQIL